MLNIFFIGVAMVLILDVANFRQTIKEIIAFFLSLIYKMDVKPENVKFNICTLCCTWWLSLIYLIATSQFNIIMIVYALVISCITPQIYDGFMLLIDIIEKIINTISKWITK